jgi:endonuclease/exonuclease/phosphatase family metal-dependent hydrolase
MRRRLSALFQIRLHHLVVLEAALIGVFFVQALRLLIALLYSRIASASQYPALDLASVDPTLPGLVEPSIVSGETAFTVYMVALPLLAVIVGRWGWITAVAAGLTAAGRYLMIADTAITPATGAAMAVGGGLLYMAYLARHRASAFPYFFVIGLAVDQLFRAFGDTLDPSWSPDTIVMDFGTQQVMTYLGLQTVLSITAALLGLLTAALTMRKRVKRSDDPAQPSERSLITFWGGMGIGGLLFLELSLLAMPNAIVGRSNAGYVAYTTIVPFLIAATLLPLIPWVRLRARGFIGLFDSSVRGWSWMLILALLIVFGVRFEGLLAAAALALAQFCAMLIWWWIPRPQASREINLSGLWVTLGALTFGVLVVADNFTFEYAFVRDFAPELAFLNDIIPPLLRGFRGLGLGVILISVLLAATPMVQMRRRVAWTGGSTRASLLASIMVAAAGIIGAIAAQPPVVRGLINPETVRIGTYNIHAGFNEFYYFDLEALALTILESGADIVLLQEVEAGRITSFGTDQALWLARRTGMDGRFYPTNEGLQGLAVLSRIEIVFDTGYLLTSTGTQTGLQLVQVRPDENLITIYNTWLGVLLATGSPDTLIAQEADQQQQLNEIFAIISSQTTGEQLIRSRTVLGGTFNNVPDSPLIDQIRELGGTNPLFYDAFAGRPLDNAATYWRTRQRARFDYLWITPLLWVTLDGADVMPRNASDHRMAVIEVGLN